MANVEDDNPAGHGVHGTTRDDGKQQEEPEGTDSADEAAWADATEKGADAS